MKILITEQLSKNKYKDNSGYLICKDAILARTGTQQYLSKELFTDGDDTIIDVDRPKEEVLNEKTIASFENKPVTDEHPDVDVVPLNCKDLQIGFARDIHAGVVDGQDVILGTLVITDANAIEMIETGEKVELSCGYDCDIMKDEEGNYYQANIRGNHIALCEAGRAGIARIVDSKIEDETKYYFIPRGTKIEAYNTHNFGKDLPLLEGKKSITTREPIKAINKHDVIELLKDEFDKNYKKLHPMTTWSITTELSQYYKIKDSTIVEDDKNVNVKVCLSKQRYAVVSTKEWRTWKDDAYADITTDIYKEAKQYQDGCKYDTIIIDCYNNYSILDSKTNDGYFSRYQSGDFRDGVYKVMKRSTYEIDKKRHDLQANPGPTFDNLAEAKAKAKQLGPDYVVVNLYTRMIIDSMLKDTAMTITVQCYILDGDKILIQDRVSDVWHGLAVPGGHVKNDETTEAACIREIKEETGLDVKDLVLFGTNEYTCEEDGQCIALLYKTSTFSGELQSSDEGEVKWMTIDEVLKSDNTAEGFKDLLTKCVGNVVKDSSIKDYGTTRKQFRQSDLDDKDSWLGTTEWGTPKGSMYVYVEGSSIVAECKGIAYGDPKGIFKFGSLQEFNRWLNDGKMYDSLPKNIQYTKRIIDKKTIFDLKVDGKYVASFDSFNTMIFYISKYSK